MALALLTAAGLGGAVLLRPSPLARAETAASRGDLRTALVELRNALRTAPDSAEVHLQMARLQMKLADPVAAQKEFRAAAALGADRWAMLFELGDAMLAQGLHSDVLAQVPPRGPTPELAAKNLYLRAIAQLALAEPAAAQRTLEEARAVAPDSLHTLLITARMAAARNDAAATRTAVDAVLQRDPAQIDALVMKERLLTLAGNRAEALGVSEQAVRAAPWSAMARMNRTGLLIHAGQDDLAQAEVDAVLAGQPRFTEAVYYNAMLMARRGKLAEASAELMKLEKVAVRFPPVLFYQAEVNLRLGRPESAAEGARRYVSLVPGDPDGKRLLARAELDARRPLAALQVLQKAIVDGQDDPDTLDLLGRAMNETGDLAAALGAFRRAAGKAPDDAVILTHLGLTQLQTGDTAEATATLERSFALAPDLRVAGEALVTAALAQNAVGKAEDALARLRARIGETETVGVLTGLVRLARGDTEAANAALVGTLRAFPASVDARLALVRVLLRQGRRTAALSLLAEMLTRTPANLAALNIYLPLLLQDNQVPPAIQALEAARRAAPKQLALTAMLADAYSALGAPERAISMLDEMGGAAKLPPVLMGPLARAQLASGAVEDAKCTWQALLVAEPRDLVARAALVDLLVRRNELAAARAVLLEGVKVMPGNLRLISSLLALDVPTRGLQSALATADALRADPAQLPAAAVLRGDLLVKARQPDEAARAFAAEFAQAPSPMLLMRLAATLSEAGRDEEAAVHLRTWLAHSPDTLPALQGLAQIDLRAGRLAAARASLEAILERRPNDPLALNNLAWAYHLDGDARARTTAQRAYLVAPGPDTGDTLGWIMVQEGDVAPAVPLLSRARAQRPGDPGIRYHLAAALAGAGQTQEAAGLLTALVQATEAFDDKAAAQALQARLATAIVP